MFLHYYHEHFHILSVLTLMFDGKWQLTGRAYECEGVDVFGVGGGIQTGQGPTHRHPHQVEPFLPHPQLAHNLQQKQCGQTKS